jgi:outer membrane protein assembly factor BamB
MEGIYWACSPAGSSVCLDNGTLQAVGLDLTSGHVRWVQAEGSTEPLAVDPTTGVAVEDTGLALSLTDGKQLWSLPVAGGAGYWVAPAAHAGFVAFDPLHDTLAVVSTTGHTLATAAVPPPANPTLDVRSHLAVNGGFVAVVTESQRLYMFTLKA